MAAVEEILRKNGLETVEIANYNTPTQIVVSGAQADVERAGILFERGSVMYIPLNVSGAFHTRCPTEIPRIPCSLFQS